MKKGAKSRSSLVRFELRQKMRRKKPVSLFETISNPIKEAMEFQLWFAKLGGIIENEQFENVIEKFK